MDRKRKRKSKLFRQRAKTKADSEKPDRVVTYGEIRRALKDQMLPDELSQEARLSNPKYVYMTSLSLAVGARLQFAYDHVYSNDPLTDDQVEIHRVELHRAVDKLEPADLRALREIACALVLHPQDEQF